MSEKVVGILNDKIINLLNLDPDLEGKEIFLSSKRKKHMKKHKREFLDFEKSFNEIHLVINSLTTLVYTQMVNQFSSLK